jgi:RimJ/RimL family protein N-acetyltransferase
MDDAGSEVNSLGQRIGRPVPGWTPRPRPPRRAIEGRWCTLEPLDAARHAERLHAANALDQDGRMWTYLPYGPFPDLGSYRAWAEDVASRDDPLFFAIVDRQHGRPTGVASLMRIDCANGSIEIGHIALSPELQRTRAATEGLVLLASLALGELGYRRLEWKCDALNEASRRAAARLGFTYEGTFRQAVVVKGRNRDTAWLSIVDGEWPRLREAFARWLAPENFDEAGSQRVALSALTAAR